VWSTTFLLPPESAAQDPTDVIGYGDKWLYGNLTLQGLFGNVDSATVTDSAGNFAQDNLEWILDYLATNAPASAVVEATAGTVSGNVWRHYFGSGKRLTTSWPFTVVIGGAPYQEIGESLHVLPGAWPGADAGIEVHLDGATWPPGTEFRAIYRLEIAAVVTTPTEEVSLALPIHYGTLETVLDDKLLQP